MTHSSPCTPGSQVPSAHLTRDDPKRGPLGISVTRSVCWFVLYCLPWRVGLCSSEVVVDDCGIRGTGWCPQEVGLTGGHCGGHRTDCTGSAPGGEVLSCPMAPPRPSIHASFHPLTIPPQLSVRLLEVQLSRETVTEGKHDLGGSVRARGGSEPPTLTYPSVSPPPSGAFSDPTRSQAPNLTLPGFHSEHPGKTGGL